MSTERPGCGLRSLLSMNYHCHIEAFAHHLHTRLQTLVGLGHTTTGIDTQTEDENIWLAVTDQQPQLSSSLDKDHHFDFDLDSPGSPINGDETGFLVKSPQALESASGSESSDGAYFDLKCENPMSVVCSPSSVSQHTQLKCDRYAKESDQHTELETTESLISNNSTLSLSCKSDDHVTNSLTSKACTETILESPKSEHTCNDYLKASNYTNTEGHAETGSTDSLLSTDSIIKGHETIKNDSWTEMPTISSFNDSKCRSYQGCSIQNILNSSHCESPISSESPEKQSLDSCPEVTPSTDLPTTECNESFKDDSSQIRTLSKNESGGATDTNTSFSSQSKEMLVSSNGSFTIDKETLSTNSMLLYGNDYMAVDLTSALPSNNLRDPSDTNRENCEPSCCRTYNRNYDICSFTSREVLKEPSASITVGNSFVDQLTEGLNLSHLNSKLLKNAESCNLNSDRPSGLVTECSTVYTTADKQDDDDEEDENHLNPTSYRVRRCSSLKTGKTPPGTPGRKKIVRFADVLGLDLADVRTFLDEIPKVPRSAYEDLQDADLSLGSLAMPVVGSTLVPGTTKTGKCLVALFQQPGGQPDFLERVRERQVCLESAVVSDPVTFSVAGYVRVRNLDFNKSVHVRYSLDGWKTFADLQATYIPNSCDGFSDKFSFMLFAHTLGIGQRLEFAIRFQCKGSQYWDSNQDANYAFQCLPPVSSPQYLPLPSPEEYWTSFY